MTSWASRRRVRDRRARQIGNELGAQGLFETVHHVLLHRVHLQHAADDVDRDLLGQDGEHPAGMCRGQLREHHRDGLRVLVLEIIGEHVFLHMGQLLPHVAAGGTADFVHDADNALGGQKLLEQAFGRLVIAHDGAGARQPLHELDDQPFDRRGCDGAEGGHRDADLAQLAVVELGPDLRAVLLAERKQENRRALRPAHGLRRRSRHGAPGGAVGPVGGRADCLSHDASVGVS
jgi:hypothetical protein